MSASTFHQISHDNDNQIAHYDSPLQMPQSLPNQSHQINQIDQQDTQIQVKDDIIVADIQQENDLSSNETQYFEAVDHQNDKNSNSSDSKAVVSLIQMQETSDVQKVIETKDAKKEPQQMYLFYVYGGNYPETVVDSLQRRGNWQEAKEEENIEKCHFLWRPFNYPQDVYKRIDKRIVRNNQIFVYNHFEILKGLTSKSGLVRSLKQYYFNNELARSAGYSIFDSTPTTFLLASGVEDAEHTEMIQRYKDIQRGYAPKERIPIKHCVNNIWLVKPSNANQGRGIEIFSDLEDLTMFVASRPQYTCCVVQKYVERPLLFKGRKFDIRVWALFTAKHEVFMYKHGYLRTSSDDYNLNNGNNYVHLTNNCLQKFGDNYGAHEDGNTVSFQVLQDFLDETFPKYKISVQDHFIPRMRDLIIDSFLATKQQLNPNRRKHCYELLGYDFLIDEDFRLWMIEINTNPYFGVPNVFIANLLPKMMDYLLDIVLDPIYTPHVKPESCNLPNDFELLYCEANSVHSPQPVNLRRPFSASLYPIQELAQQVGPKAPKADLKYLKQFKIQNLTLSTVTFKTKKDKLPKDEVGELSNLTSQKNLGKVNNRSNSMIGNRILNQSSFAQRQIMTPVANSLQIRNSRSKSYFKNSLVSQSIPTTTKNQTSTQNLNNQTTLTLLQQSQQMHLQNQSAVNKQTNANTQSTIDSQLKNLTSSFHQQRNSTSQVRKSMYMQPTANSTNRLMSTMSNQFQSSLNNVNLQNLNNNDLDSNQTAFSQSYQKGNRVSTLNNNQNAVSPLRVQSAQQSAGLHVSRTPKVEQVRKVVDLASIISNMNENEELKNNDKLNQDLFEEIKIEQSKHQTDRVQQRSMRRENQSKEVKGSFEARRNQTQNSGLSRTRQSSQYREKSKPRDSNQLKRDQSKSRQEISLQSQKQSDERLMVKLFNQGKKDTKDLSETELDQLFKVIIQNYLQNKNDQWQITKSLEMLSMMFDNVMLRTHQIDFMLQELLNIIQQQIKDEKVQSQLLDFVIKISEKLCHKLILAKTKNTLQLLNIYLNANDQIKVKLISLFKSISCINPKEKQGISLQQNKFIQNQKQNRAESSGIQMIKHQLQQRSVENGILCLLLSQEPSLSQELQQSYEDSKQLIYQLESYTQKYRDLPLSKVPPQNFDAYRDDLSSQINLYSNQNSSRQIIPTDLTNINDISENLNQSEHYLSPRESHQIVDSLETRVKPLIQNTVQDPDLNNSPKKFILNLGGSVDSNLTNSAQNSARLAEKIRVDLSEYRDTESCLNSLRDSSALNGSHSPQHFNRREMINEQKSIIKSLIKGYDLEKIIQSLQDKMLEIKTQEDLKIEELKQEQINVPSQSPQKFKVYESPFKKSVKTSPQNISNKQQSPLLNKKPYLTQNAMFIQKQPRIEQTSPFVDSKAQPMSAFLTKNVNQQQLDQRKSQSNVSLNLNKLNISSQSMAKQQKNSDMLQKTSDYYDVGLKKSNTIKYAPILRNKQGMLPTQSSNQIKTLYQQANVRPENTRQKSIERKSFKLQSSNNGTKSNLDSSNTTSFLKDKAKQKHSEFYPNKQINGTNDSFLNLNQSLNHYSNKSQAQSNQFQNKLSDIERNLNILSQFTGSQDSSSNQKLKVLSTKMHMKPSEQAVQSPFTIVERINLNTFDSVDSMRPSSQSNNIVNEESNYQSNQGQRESGPNKIIMNSKQVLSAAEKNSQYYKRGTQVSQNRKNLQQKKKLNADLY
eukprot:403350383